MLNVTLRDKTIQWYEKCMYTNIMNCMPEIGFEYSRTIAIYEYKGCVFDLVIIMFIMKVEDI